MFSNPNPNPNNGIVGKHPLNQHSSHSEAIFHSVSNAIVALLNLGDNTSPKGKC